MIGIGQITATDFTTNDCNGVNHNLFDSLDAGNVIVISWVMPDIVSATYSAPAYNAVQSFSTSHPGRVHFYIADDYANTTCANLINFGNYFNMPNSTFFSSADISMSDYGTNGMPKVVVLGGDSHTVYYNQNDNQINFNDVQTAIANALILQTYGCTDSLASNYNPLATIDDGSCDYSCTLSFSTIIASGNNTDCSATLYLDLILLSGTPPYSYDLYDNSGNLLISGSNSSYFYYPNICNGTYYLYLTDNNNCTGSDTVNIFSIISGCTDSTAFNYDPNTNTDDGSCCYVSGCTDVTACNYDANACNDDGSCLTAWGCMDPTECNYDASANCDDGSCLTVFGCMDPTACNYDANACNDDGSCLTAWGCMDPTECNYDASATCDDGSCLTIYGCTDSTAFNHNPLATCDDSSCIPFIYGCMDPVSNYNPQANIDDGSCCIDGCTDSTAFNHNPLATCDDSSCIPFIYGCTDVTAINYDVLANIDNGSCYYCDVNISPTALQDPTSGLCNGAIIVNATSSYSTVSYSWNTGSTNNTLTSLCLGIYEVTATDSLGCSATQTYTLGNTIVCDSFNSTLYALGTESSGITADDEHSGIVNLGFTFDFYGQSYNQLVISGNGYLTFDLSQANQYSPYTIYTPIPNPGSMPENAIMCPWQDMNSGIGGNITYEAVGVAPNRKFIVTWCGVPMFSCTSLLHTSQVVLYETTDKIEMFLENKPVCSHWNGGNAVQGLVDATSTFFDIVVDPPSALPRNFPLQWVAVNEAWEFLPNNPASSYQINPISYIPIVAGQNIWSNANGDILGYGSTLDVNISSTNTYFANYNGVCTTSSSYDSITIIVNYCGCTDPSAGNYDANATVDDGSCTYVNGCTDAAPTGLFVDGIISTRAVINWDNMNSSTCTVDQYRIRYQEVGTSSWTQKTMGGPVGSCVWGNQRIDKLLLNLTGGTTYEYQMKAWYCGGGSSAWTGLSTFTTADNCPNVGNLAISGVNPTKATFTWDDSNGAYAFVRLKSRVDSISNPTGSDWFQIGGFGVNYGTYTKDKYGLTPGETYRAQARAFCDPNGGAYNSLAWTALVTWTQPTSNRIDGANAISNLDIYPNPSRDIFNVSFTSEDVQDLKVRILNLIGEELVNEDLQQFIGEYTKQIDLTNNAKGIYFLEIETKDGVINKKLILQ